MFRIREIHNITCVVARKFGSQRQDSQFQFPTALVGLYGKPQNFLCPEKYSTAFPTWSHHIYSPEKELKNHLKLTVF